MLRCCVCVTYINPNLYKKKLAVGICDVAVHKMAQKDFWIGERVCVCSSRFFYSYKFFQKKYNEDTHTHSHECVLCE